MVEIDRIYNMDCIDGFKLLDDNSIDLVVTSPPYDNLRTYNGYSFDFESVAKELYRVLKSTGVVVWIVSDATIDGSETLTSFKQALYFKEIGFKVNDTMIWEKPGFTAVGALKYRYAQVFEYMFVLTKGSNYTFNPIRDKKNIYGNTRINGTHTIKNGTRIKNSTNGKILDEYGIRYNVWRNNFASSNVERSGHPAQFPEDLICDHIISWSNEDDIILDPFMGSGTTAIACMRTNRHYIGFEISKEYVDIANTRIEKFCDTVDKRYKSIDDRTGKLMIYQKSKLFNL